MCNKENDPTRKKEYRDKVMSPADYQRMKNQQKINHGKKRKK